jgi:hypothetical protein
VPALISPWPRRFPVMRGSLSALRIVRGRIPPARVGSGRPRPPPLNLHCPCPHAFDALLNLLPRRSLIRAVSVNESASLRCAFRRWLRRAGAWAISGLVLQIDAMVVPCLPGHEQ